MFVCVSVSVIIIIIILMCRAGVRQTLRSAATSRLIVPSVKLSTVGSRAFPAAASSIWNSLPETSSVRQLFIIT